MFEAQQQQKSGNGGMWIGIIVVLIIVAALTWYVMRPKSAANNDSAGTLAPANQSAANADAVHDLRAVSATMGKDPTGTVAMWSVDLRNMSHTYGYKNIAYRTTYIGADDSVLLQNTGTLTLSLDPGDEQTTQFRDALYPSGTARYTFVVTGATASK